MKMAPRVREADRVELWEAAEVEPLEALAMSVENSLEAWTGIVDGEIVCMFGLSAPSMTGDVAFPWLLGTDLIRRHAKVFLGLNRPVIERWQTLFPVLLNYVHSSNTTAMAWLRWMGFTIFNPEPYGPHGSLFCKFERRA